MICFSLFFVLSFYILPQKNSLSTTVFKLAALDEALFEALVEVFQQFEERGLKSQKRLKTSVLAEGGKADMKPHNFLSFVQIHDEEVKGMLLHELSSGKISIPEFSKECGLVAKRQVAQKAFLKELGEQSWEAAERRYPLHTSPEALDRFSGVNLKERRPVTWTNFVKSARESRDKTGMNAFMSITINSA